MFHSIRRFSSRSYTHRIASSTARTFAMLRQSASFGLSTAFVLGGIGVIGYTGYQLTHELVLPNSENQIYQKTFKMIQKDMESVKMLGRKMRAHGEPTTQRNVKSRPLAVNRFTDRFGREHIKMRFYIDGRKQSGTVQLETITNETGVPEYRYILLESDNKKHYLVNNDDKLTPKRDGGLFGIKWGKSSKRP